MNSYLNRTSILLMLAASIMAILAFSACKKDDSVPNPASGNDHGTITFHDTAYTAINYIPSTVTTLPSHFYLTLGGDYTGGYAHTIGLRLAEKPTAASGTINLQNNSGANFVDLVVHSSPVLNFGHYHYYAKAGDTLSYTVTNGKLKIIGTNLTETDLDGNVSAGGHPMSFVSQE